MSDPQIPSEGDAFQQEFRGSREEIARRLSVYLPVLEEAGVRELDGEVLDIGFGRGEWLFLLADHGYRAVGVDLDAGAVAAAREAGLDVAAGDALQALRERPDESLAAVTAFHVVEHIPGALLAGFVREVHRVLAPGGVVILETPNPENVAVGTTSFYIDPDHERPVPGPLLEFHARQAGFAQPFVARVNRECLDAPLPQVSFDVPGAPQINAAIYAVNGLLFAAPDQALLAQKAGGPAREFEREDWDHFFGPQSADLATYRRVAAEEAAARLAAEAEAARERAEQLQREADEAAERAAAAETLVEETALQAAEAAARAELAEARSLEVQAGLEQAHRDLGTVAGSLSWRVTAPLRGAAAAARALAGGAGPGAPGPKRYAKLAVGHPMRWVLSHPRLGPTVDRSLTRVPVVERKVRIAVYETTVATREEVVVEPLGDMDDLPESARSVALDLQRIVPGEPQ